MASGMILFGHLYEHGKNCTRDILLMFSGNKMLQKQQVLFLDLNLKV